MKRMYFGIGLLVVLLGAGIGLTAAFSAFHEPLAAQLTRAQQAALEENWTEANTLVADARAQWQRHRHLTAAVADHEPLEQMDALFRRLEALGKLQEVHEFAADCAELARLTMTMSESQKLTWWNIL